MIRNPTMVKNPTRAVEVGAEAMYEYNREHGHRFWTPWDDLPRDSPNSAHHTWLALASVCLEAVGNLTEGEHDENNLHNPVVTIIGPSGQNWECRAMRSVPGKVWVRLLNLGWEALRPDRRVGDASPVQGSTDSVDGSTNDRSERSHAAPGRDSRAHTTADPRPDARPMAPAPEPAPEPQKITKWEYMVWELYDGRDNVQATLNKFGQEGWELVSLIRGQNLTTLYYFKRPT